MSVLIKGMKMPQNCFNCSTKIDPENRRCDIDRHIFEETLGKLTTRRDDDCPLVEVPTPHGPLIDEDVFIREINERIDAAIKWGTNAIADRENETRLRAEQAVATFCEASLTAKKMPTIIEAEEGEEA